MVSDLAQLIPHLIEATSGGKLDWVTREGGSENDFYTYIAEKYEINVWAWTDEDTGLSGHSASLKRAPFDKPSIDIVSSDEYSPRSATLAQLHAAARRNAYQVDKAIEEIKDALGVIPF